MTKCNGERFLLTFCNQKSSLMHSVCVLETGTWGISWVSLDWIPDDVKLDLGGSAGVCRVGNAIALCTQSMESALLAILDLRAAEPLAVIPLADVRDPHSIAWSGDYVYVTSTGTNEIHRVRIEGTALGEQEVFWRYPGTGDDADEIHLNGIVATNEGLLATCFGAKTADGAWGTDGQLFHVESFTPIRERLRQPHTPTIIDGKLYFAESGAGKIHVCERGEGTAWRTVTEFPVNGYGRGIAAIGGDLLIGVSAKRRVSRSRNTLVDDELDLKTAQLALLDVDSGVTRSLFDLSAFAREVYEILPVDTEIELGTQMDALRERVQEMESTVERSQLRVNTWNAKLLERDTKLQERELALRALDQKYEALQLELSLIRAPHRIITGPIRRLYRLLLEWRALKHDAEREARGGEDH